MSTLAGTNLLITGAAQGMGKVSWHTSNITVFFLWNTRTQR
jgi:hypothetical protein